MTDWEYLELRLIQNIKDGHWYWSDTKLSTNANERLDKMGAEGWELVSTYTVIKTVENNIFTSRISYILSVHWNDAGVLRAAGEGCFAIHLNRMKSYIRENI